MTALAVLVLLAAVLNAADALARRHTASTFKVEIIADTTQFEEQLRRVGADIERTINRSGALSGRRPLA